MVSQGVWITSGLILLGFWGLNHLSKTLIKKLSDFKQVPFGRYQQIYKYFRAILTILAGVALMLVWGVDYKGLVVVATSVLAMLAVALVAQWSILSNITAGVVIFFAFPIRIGDRMEVIDGASSVQGEIVEITLFHVILKESNGQWLSYPNNLVLQKAVRKLPRDAEDKKPALASLQKRLAQRDSAGVK
ncbi:mechanosensitive ion channel domain-containing protein [Hydrogenovibrio halophilus]|uniref:mechanosensitive ion channel domain-containing protein n=1 Tax=Hydrogenovibrio halophilus TaxID=373391 RepID=UPI0003638E8E|nr:mechanosensitive ion channel domain-containing protein [Hydrogenovibrio halophilus]